MPGNGNPVFVAAVLIRESIKDRYVPRAAPRHVGGRLRADRTNLRFVSDTMLDPFSRYLRIFARDQSGSDRCVHRIAICSLTAICHVINAIVTDALNNYFQLVPRYIFNKFA